jgi:hypothetical protein
MFAGHVKASSLSEHLDYFSAAFSAFLIGISATVLTAL